MDSLLGGLIGDQSLAEFIRQLFVSSVFGPVQGAFDLLALVLSLTLNPLGFLA